MANTVGVNKMSVVTQDSNGTTVAFPDVCKTPSPGGPVPIPYPNVARSADTAQGSKTVTVGCGPSLAPRVRLEHPSTPDQYNTPSRPNHPIADIHTTHPQHHLSGAEADGNFCIVYYVIPESNIQSCITTSEYQIHELLFLNFEARAVVAPRYDGNGRQRGCNEWQLVL